MSHEFRDLLKQVGSGSHTSRALTRAEAEAATRMMLTQTATPAQIGAFMIAHRIKRPTADELAGTLDAYAALGPTLPAIAPNSAYNRPALVLSCPYDGRSRTAPVTLITALVVAAAGVPVVMHGGDRMPTKEGIPLVELWEQLGVELRSHSLEQAHTLLNRTGIGFVYLPQHFPLAHGLVSYREQIGKRPPFATVELLWSPYAGPHTLVMGFVHPPTEEFAKGTFALRGQTDWITVKGLEGSCDLARGRTAIVGVNHPGQTDRLLLHPRDYGLEGDDVELGDEVTLGDRLLDVILGNPSELAKTALWNAGFYLWQGGAADSLEAGLAQAQDIIATGGAIAKLNELQLQAASLNQPLAYSRS
ncbi:MULTISPECIES: anthranilate phosphoribosyltransferase family protein [Cyanophyceae]|uniref:anthranilate phosphoribosyltransferase family protein n=1 Tax=Cyanophyceae TaxID=3028117 RepID=UPI001683DCC2|nr:MULTISPECIES: anthranilate phosphoribosyltransferase family protein [Cyanophyceae]MBD1914977.1 anthranilate phosphoribosyltransferase family protein [Phormidium sp. FACHB-77]MBD2032764.1 anthranilate phosphoribosyltransferase family protein [Phormidium sp. FACHB-322]MBD2049909.1 anthranilate phosphoribosyltransferase family protein [Leptolyngbya sp. FACHB-60]